jgi:tetratricopeptide (TPR) repeat protein
MTDRTSSRDGPTEDREDTQSLVDALITLGEGRAAIDLLRRQVNAARSALPVESLTLLRLLSQYAGVLESTDALAEADFIRAEALEIVASTQVPTLDAVDAFLKHGLLLCKMHNYDGAVAKLKEAIRRTEELDDVAPLHRQIILAHAWRSQAQAFEALGEFSQASNALDVLLNVKRQIRLLVFSPSRGR